MQDIYIFVIQSQLEIIAHMSSVQTVISCYSKRARNW